MRETLTLEEIKTRYPSQWVLIGEPETDDLLEVVAGEVLSHSHDRDEVDRRAPGVASTSVCAPLPGNHARQHGDRAMSFPFDPSRGPIFVRGQISGPLGLANLNLILDTGATTSLIRGAILISIGYDPDGVEVIPRVVLNRLTALGQHRIGIPVPSHSLPQEAGVDGLLGLDFLRVSALLVDFRGGRVTLT